MSLDEHWFSEPLEPEGVAFSLRVTEKLHDERTAYQHLEVYETARWGRLMLLDGCVMLTSRDNFIYHEMMSHPALFAHPDPRDVLIIGGGDCGTLREVLKHPGVNSATQVDIDEAVTRASERFFPELCQANDDPRARLLFADGVRHVAEARPDSLDVVIVDSTDPVGPAEGLFGEPFLRDVRRALRPGGIMVQQSESPLFHSESIIGALHTAMGNAGFDTVRTLTFPLPSYPGGWWSATLGGKGADVTALRPQAAEPGFETRYYNGEIHAAAFAAPQFCRGAFGAG